MGTSADFIGNVFPPALAFGAGQLPPLFDDVSFSIAGGTNHFVLLFIFVHGERQAGARGGT
jgi:hypothetical protein